MALAGHARPAAYSPIAELPRPRTATSPMNDLAGRTGEGRHSVSIEETHPSVAAVLANAGALGPLIKSMLRVIEETVPVQRIWLDTAENKETPRTGFEGEPNEVARGGPSVIRQPHGAQRAYSRRGPQVVVAHRTLPKISRAQSQNWDWINDQSEVAAAQAELLENVVATAQRLIKAEKDESKITPSFIAEKVKRAADMFAADSPLPINQQQAVSILIQRFSHWMGKATTLKDNHGHLDWLNASRKQDWHYWRRYRDFQEAKLSDVVVDGLDEATDNILELLEDPLRTGAWDRRGLVVGHVQSGKTSNYSGLV